MRTVILLLVATLAFAQQTWIYKPRHRTAEDLALIVKGTFPQATVTPAGMAIVVRAVPEELSQIKNLLADLDRKLKRVRVSVRRATHEETSALAARMRIHPRVQADLGSREANANAQADRSVETVEGEWAKIQDWNGQIEVLVRLSKSEAEIETRTSEGRVEAGPISSSRNVVHGLVGDWIMFGSVTGSGDAKSKGIGGKSAAHYETGAGKSSLDLWVKAEISGN